ncbi:hypothetical protein DFH06DRAFT_1317027 [Mycena polygramma]|nr:hypothetical protein DFH06DRAFT_1317027 [Mycena polygramma]
MTSHSSRSQAAPAAGAVALTSAVPFGGFLVLVPMPMVMGACFPQGFAPGPVAVTPPAAPATAPAASATSVDASASAPSTAPAATRPPPGAGLPAPLVALLRDADGPFLANEVFSVAPNQALDPIEEETPAPEWYAITRGRFVGVVDQHALSAVAISGVAHSRHKAYTTQREALDAFNRALEWGGVSVA